MPRVIRGLSVLFVLFGVILFTTTTLSASPPDPEHKVEICHRTNSNTNPYVSIEVDESAVDGTGGADHYGRHKGPVWNSSLKAQHVKWGDIIPPTGNHNGLNWTAEGRAVYDNGCIAYTTAGTTTTTEREVTIYDPTPVVPPVGPSAPPSTLMGTLPKTGTGLGWPAVAGAIAALVGYAFLNASGRVNKR